MNWYHCSACLQWEERRASEGAVVIELCFHGSGAAVASLHSWAHELIPEE